MTYAFIGEATLASDATVLEITGIPGDYTDLLINVEARSDRGANDDLLQVRFNTFSFQYIYDEVVLFPVFAYDSVNLIHFRPAIVGDFNTTNLFSSTKIYVSKYASSEHKPVSIESAASGDNNTKIFSFLAGKYRNTAPITSIHLGADGATNLKAGSSVTIYGIS